MDGEIVACPQLPTTLPTLDELIGLSGLTADTVADDLLQRTASAESNCQVYTLHAELEGQKLAAVFQRLLEGWRAQGYRLVSMATLLESLNTAQLPRHSLVWGTVPGRSGELLVQGSEFLYEPHANILEELA